MILIRTNVGPFRSINQQQTVTIDQAVTVLVGMNEAGKTIYLKALEKANDALDAAEFNEVEDYPRKDLSAYLKAHETNPAEACSLTYKLTSEEIADINANMKLALTDAFEFSTNHNYDNKKTISLTVDEKPVVAKLITDANLSSDAVTALEKVKSLREIPDALKSVNLTEVDTAFKSSVEARIAKTKWPSVIAFELWSYLESRVPKFLYFSDYDILPSKINLTDLAGKVEQAKTDKRHLNAKHRAVLALLRMADIAVAEFTKAGGYEPLKAKIEAVSINLTDQIMEFWKQNEDLEVEIDIKNDPDDVAPFNNGPNLYLRIKNRRHRGVSTPFEQRSRGFIWFFSFLVWFDSVQHQLDIPSEKDRRQLILLLDEPGLALHALAQADFLKYIDTLSTKHQVLYTTHSPFMVHSDRLNQVRLVEDKATLGTVISDSVTDSDQRTIFPLQAALGWTIAQNLFISKNNLLVEGPSELIYLKLLSAVLESKGRAFLREDVTIVPVGGLDKVVTFIALLGASGLKLVVLHDYRGAPEQKLVDLVHQKIVSPKNILNASQFRDVANIGKNGPASDIEDLFSTTSYMKLFSDAFSAQLKAVQIEEKMLPPGDRIINRIERYLEANKISIRSSGGFNHYLVASFCASKHDTYLDLPTLDRFEALIKQVNSLFV